MSKYPLKAMNERIEQLLEEIRMSPSLFADAIGVQRATISHILSGRNNPSLDLVQKVLSKFPELNPDWILSGKGEMWRNPITQKPEIKSFEQTTQSRNLSSQPELFTQRKRAEEVIDSELKPGLGKSDHGINKISKPEIKAVGIENNNKFSSTKGSSNKQVAKVVLLYNDGTFEAFTP